MPSAFARSADMTTVAAAPSEVCEELPAVAVPLAWNAGLSAARAGRDVSARGPSWTLKRIAGRFAFGPWGLGAILGEGWGEWSTSQGFGESFWPPIGIVELPSTPPAAMISAPPLM